MGICRVWGSQGVEQEEHLWHPGEEVLAPNGVGDSHVGVVDCVSQEEHGRAVRAPDDEVLEVVGRERDLTAHDVLELHCLPRRHPEPHSQAIGYRGALDLGVVGVAQVGETPSEEIIDDLAVAVEALRLVEGSLVPVEAQPLEFCQEALCQFGAVAFGVGVLDTQHVGATCRAGEQPVEQGRPRASNVEEAGWRWCKPDSGGHRAETTGGGVAAGLITGVRGGARDPSDCR